MYKKELKETVSIMLLGLALCYIDSKLGRKSSYSSNQEQDYWDNEFFNMYEDEYEANKSMDDMESRGNVYSINSGGKEYIVEETENGINIAIDDPRFIDPVPLDVDLDEYFSEDDRTSDYYL